MALRGRMDGVFQGRLRGWLWDPDDPLRRLSGRVFLDGQPLAEIRGVLPRPDLEAVGYGEGGGGFELAVPITAQDGAQHEFRLVAEQLWVSIEVDRLSLVLPPRLHMLRGRVQGIAGGHCIGWAWDAARPLDRLTVELLQDGEVLARQPAALRRAELSRAGIGDGAHGFAFDLARLSPTPTEGARLELRAVGAHGEWPLGVVSPQAGQIRPAVAPTPREDPGGDPGAGPLGGMSRRRILSAIRKAEAEQDHAGAARLLDAALLDQPDDPDLLSIRARLHLAQQELEPAERLARAVLAEHPGHERAALILARACTALGRHEAAIEAWRAIGPRDAAFRERVTKRTRSLIALRRRAEALQEAAEAARACPDDAELLRHLALTAEAAGAPRAALAHWRRVLERLPEDRLGRERVAHAAAMAGPAAAEALASPLVNPDLRDWPGPLEAWAGAEATWPAPGMRLRALGGRAMATPAEPWQLRPGDLPGYGLLLQGDGGGAEVGFTLATRDALRMALEWRGWAPAPDLILALRRTDAGGGEGGERALGRFATGARPCLHRFDLVPEADEREAAGLELVLRLAGAGAVLLRPPRPLARLRPAAPATQGFECADLALAPPAPRRDGRRADALVALATPFTSIVIAAPPEALSATIQRVLGGTAAPFECWLALQAEWPAALAEALRALAALDPRLRLLPPDAAAPTGWVALVQAPPPGGAEWLSELHREAAAKGVAEAPGVRLSHGGQTQAR